MKIQSAIDNDDLRTEYEFDYSKAIRGKYIKQLLAEGANIIVLEPENSKEIA